MSSNNHFMYGYWLNIWTLLLYSLDVEAYSSWTIIYKLLDLREISYAHVMFMLSKYFSRNSWEVETNKKKW